MNVIFENDRIDVYLSEMQVEELRMKGKLRLPAYLKTLGEISINLIQEKAETVDLEDIIEEEEPKMTLHSDEEKVMVPMEVTEGLTDSIRISSRNLSCRTVGDSRYRKRILGICPTIFGPRLILANTFEGKISSQPIKDIFDVREEAQ